MCVNDVRDIPDMVLSLGLDNAIFDPDIVQNPAFRQIFHQVNLISPFYTKRGTGFAILLINTKY